MNGDGRSDEALLAAWCAGEVKAFDALYARYEGPLFGFLFHQLGGVQADAEDVLHQVFLAVLKEGQAKRVLRLRPFLYETARHACLNRARSARRGAGALELTRVEPQVAEPPDVLLEGKQNARALQAALERLPMTLSEVYALRAAGLSYEEVAGVLQVPVGTVKSRLHALVSRLREELSHEL